MLNSKLVCRLLRSGQYGACSGSDLISNELLTVNRVLRFKVYLAAFEQENRVSQSTLSPYVQCVRLSLKEAAHPPCIQGGGMASWWTEKVSASRTSARVQGLCSHSGLRTIHSPSSSFTSQQVDFQPGSHDDGWYCQTGEIPFCRDCLSSNLSEAATTRCSAPGPCQPAVQACKHARAASATTRSLDR
jgi:hypothetical protein